MKTLKNFMFVTILLLSSILYTGCCNKQAKGDDSANLLVERLRFDGRYSIDIYKMNYKGKEFLIVRDNNGLSITHIDNYKCKCDSE